MKINIKKIIRPLDLGEKAKEYSGQMIQVWVNPTLEALKERDVLFLKYAEKQKALNEAEKAKSENITQLIADFNAWIDGEFSDKNNEWFARLWSQDENTLTHWAMSEINDLRSLDPALLDWMKSISVEMIRDYRAQEKKR
jgi:hypothetical protein